ncbi:MAG: protein kinase [Acidobacteriota bacterium]|nr:protein kinase [Acidobacteriota bacterium]
MARPSGDLPSDMNAWKRVEDLFLAAGELPPAERPAFLQAQCGNDRELRAEVESLLAHDAGGVDTSLTGIVRRSAVNVVETGNLSGRRIGAYRIVDTLGYGGMGSVYLAVRDDDQFSRKVAIKFIRYGFNSPGAIDRFLRERQILANLNHPYIAKLLDGGTTGDGIPYFVMEYIEGTPVDEYCEKNKLSIEDRCEMFRRICEAVSCAHRNLIVHRDLKPGNILVNADSAPMLLDFGIAKLLDGANDSNMTGGPWMLTPDYASPEQVRGEPTNTASDIYSLGIVLFQLLTGAKPYHVKSTTPLEIEKAICTGQPPRPSSVRRDRKLRGDLDNIVLMALRKEPERRYATVDGFSEDVRRYLRKLPVMAREDTFTYRAGKFIRRNRAGVLAGSLAAAGLIASTAVTALEARRAEQARRTAEAERSVAVEQRQRAQREEEAAAKASDLATRRALEADLATQRAQKRLSDLVGLGNATLFHVSDELEHVPGGLEARRNVIQTTVRYLDGLSAEAKDDIALYDLLGTGYTQVGDVLGFPGRPNLGDREGAIAAWNKAKTIFTRIETIHPGDVSAELQDLGVHQRIGMVIETAGDVQGAIGEYRAALKIALSLAKAHPSEVDIMDQPAIIEHPLGLALLRIHDPDAEPVIRDEIRVYEAAHRLDPKNQQVARTMPSSYASLGRVYVARGDFGAALEQMLKGHRIREDFSARYPADPLLKSGLASSWETIAIVKGATWQPSKGDSAGALADIAKALPLRREIYRIDPANRKAKTDLAACLTWAGALNPDPAQSIPLLTEAASLLTELRTADAKQVSYREQFALAKQYIGRRLATQGDLAGAIAAYRESVATKPDPAVSAELAASETRLRAGK